VDLAEQEKKKSYDLNALAVKYLAEASKRYNIVLIHISTDYLFDGTKKLPYLESDSTNPIDVYGQSKLLGEHHIQAHLERHYIIRTSWLFSKFNRNFVEKIYHKLSNNEQLTVITSQKGVPTSCEDVAYFLMVLIASRITDFGSYHYVPNGETTWCGLALHVAKFLNKVSHVTAIANYKSKARRPLYIALANHKVEVLIKKTFRNWSEGVDEVLKVLSVE
jgi:dTDP-4-dehydrorhamnose reductase